MAHMFITISGQSYGMVGFYFGSPVHTSVISFNGLIVVSGSPVIVPFLYSLVVTFVRSIYIR